MRVFMCAFGNFFVAVPMNSVSSLMLYTKALNDNLLQNDGEDTCIYLPTLFDFKLDDTPYGIILKNTGEIDNSNKGKVILITGDIECEIEIPDIALAPLPKIFGLFRFSRFFSSILFAAVSNISRPILVLNPETLISFCRSKKND